ncbi:cytochrome p450 [Apiospora hydei]|uniref:Cytochrome p450 n=1 Tax=Apiospora hydei TaxID=1337664 RepID=A0ABR1WA07_9PEZI
MPSDAVGSSGGPFAFMIFGTTFYVITQAKHASEIDKNTEALSFDEFVQDFIRSAGLSESAVQACFLQRLAKEKSGFPNPSGHPLGILIRQMQVHQLHPGVYQRALEARFLRSFHRQLRVEHISHITQAQTSGPISMYKWCADFFTRAGEYAYFGNTLGDIDPDFSKKFYVFDELSWQITYRIPKLFAKKMSAAQNTLQRSLKTYFQIPQSQRDETAWFTTAVEDELRAIGVSDDDIATIFLTVYLTINTNTRRATFWMMAYILHSPSLVQALRNEIAQAFEGYDLVNPSYVFDKSLCPQLEAVWLETLRLSSSGSSVRCINKDTIIGGKILRKGNKIMIPSRLLHMDDTIYTEDSSLFRPERFLDTGNRVRGGWWRPFGGGKSICTGRYVAEHAIKMCVSIILHRFDVRLTDGAHLPQGDEGIPGLGIMGLKKGEDTWDNVSARSFDG